jgi:hypothetical protein
MAIRVAVGARMTKNGFALELVNPQISDEWLSGDVSEQWGLIRYPWFTNQVW